MRTTVRLDDALMRKVRLPTFRGRGLQPGVDLDDKDALLDLMEKHSGALARGLGHRIGLRVDHQ